MRFLLDTNIVIAAEPTSPDDVEGGTASAVALLNVLAVGGHVGLLHPASIEEVRGDSDKLRAETRLVLLGRYPHLERPPSLSGRLTAILGQPAEGTNSAIDLLLLSALDADAIDYFVTEDDRLHRRAKRVGLGDRVLTAVDAAVTVRELFPSVPETPPLVAARLAYELNEKDPIFESFREDYDFDSWLTKCKREGRQCWVIETTTGYGGVCIIKPEKANVYGFEGNVLKLCSFKIAEHCRGFRYGELLLKAVFRYLVQNRYDSVFVEAYPKQKELATFLGEFGFEHTATSTKGEDVLHKQLRPRANTPSTTALEFNIKYGPHAMVLRNANAFLVPIQPRYHRLLFPELEAQLSLAPESHPFGNSIRKAYLSNSKIRKIRPGDAVFFYRSGSDQAVTAVGVAERTLVSSDAQEIARFVGNRTVYRFADIEQMTASPVLAVVFRLARPVEPSWKLDLLIRTGIMRRPPQSFMQIPRKAVEWIASELAVQL